MLFNSRFMHIIYGKWILNLFFVVLSLKLHISRHSYILYEIAIITEIEHLKFAFSNLICFFCIKHSEK